MGLRRRFRGGGMDAGAGGNFGGGPKGNNQGGDGKGKQQKSGPPAKDRFKTSQQLKQQIKDVQKVASGTAIKAGKKGQFLRDSQGNIVGYSGGAKKAKADAEKALRDTIASRIQAQEAKQVTPTQASITSVMDRMKQDRQNLLDRAKKNRITNQQLNQLGKLNRDLGFNRTTGMGVIESLRDQFTKPEFKQGIGNLIKAYQKISPMGIIMNKILNPQYEEQTGIESLPEFKGLQRTNQMFSPGVYDFTQPTSMPMQFADSMPMQFAEVTAPDLRAINLMRDAGYSPADMPRSQFPKMTDDEYRGVMEGTITEPGEYEMRDGTLQPVEEGGFLSSLFG